MKYLVGPLSRGQVKVQIWTCLKRLYDFSLSIFAVSVFISEIWLHEYCAMILAQTMWC